MTTPFRDVLSSANAHSNVESPPTSPRTTAPPEASRNPTLPRRTSSIATASSRRTPSRAPSANNPSSSPPNPPRTLRTQTITRRLGNSSTPRTRLARGGPPRVSVRERTRHAPPPADPPNLVRYHWSTAVVLAIYLPLLVVPWIITCVLSVKPLTWYGTSYQASGVYTPNDIAWVPRWVRASNILACISSALAFPVVTAVLAHASVAFVQNVRPGQKLNARELLALADGCWMRLSGVRGSWWATAGGSLLVLSMVIPMLQISAFKVEHMTVATCSDVPNSDNPSSVCRKPRDIGYLIGGYDPEPADMAMAPGNLVARKVRDQLPTLSDMTSLNHIWPYVTQQGDNWANDFGNTLYYYQKTGKQTIPFYVSTFPQTFNTGVLREHAIRFNSTISCEIVPRSSFPNVCPGSAPLAGEYNSKETRNRFCVPGDYTRTPWTIDRNRQDIQEELWVDNYVPLSDLSISINQSISEITTLSNLTTHCMTNTTRGYFELPNSQNDGVAGALLETWPSQAVLKAEFNDVEAFSTMPPAESNPRNNSDILLFRYGADPLDNWNQTTPGPLAVLINAMLGNESWFYLVQNATTVEEERDAFIAACLRGLPFSAYTQYLRNGFSSANLDCSFLEYPGKVPSLSPEDENVAGPDSSAAQIMGDISGMVAEWFSGFAYNSSTEDVLGAGIYLANEALLTMTADASKINSARPIYTSNGTSLLRPKMRNPSKAVVSFLMLAEIMALLLLAAFIYRMPTFAARMDAVHVATIGSQLAQQRATELAPLGLRPKGLARRKFLKDLEESDGMIGVQEDIELTPLTRSSLISPRTSATLTPGPGLNHLQAQSQRPAPPSSPAPSIQGIQPRPGGGAYSRVGSRVHSFASTAHTDDEITSVLDAVSEVHDPDAPPKYGDIVQADAQRAMTATYSRRLVVGGSGKITRDMAKRPKQPRAARTAFNRRPTATTLPRVDEAEDSPLQSRIRSNRSSVSAAANLGVLRTP